MAALAACSASPEANVGANESPMVSKPPPTTSDTSGGGGGGGGGSSTTADSDLTYDSNCPSNFVSRADAALDAVLPRWSNVESRAGESLNCVYKKLSGTGTIACTSSTSSCSTASPFDGSQTYAGQTFLGRTICSNWIAEIETDATLSNTEKSICYAALIAHESAHSCLKGESGAEEVEAAVRGELNNLYSKSLTGNDCWTH